MAETCIMQKAALGEFFKTLRSAGQRIIAPVRKGERVDFAEVETPDQVALDYIQSNASAKHAVFPAYEPLVRFKQTGKEVEARDGTQPARPTVLFGLHPCDAASLAVLKAVFTWDSSDAPFETKLAATTVVGISCTQADPFCFCTSVGGSPGDTRGSDVLLTPLGPDSALAEILTEKGQALVKLAPQLFTPANGQAVKKSELLAKVEPRFDAKTLTAKLPKLFDKLDVWKDQSLRCLGCGACAFVCPTCSCFDIQDEKSRDGGVRLRCWDSCGFGLFTLHASGHNPRHVQGERWRQRIMHKFSYQPERLGVLGCVGCGRCSRNCPVDMNLGQHAKQLAETKV